MSKTPFGEACDLLRECVEGTVDDCTAWNRKTRSFLKLWSESEQKEEYVKFPAMPYGHGPGPSSEKLSEAALRADGGSSKVAVPFEIYRGALNYIKHVGGNWTMRGEPHPQQWIVDGLERCTSQEESK